MKRTLAAPLLIGLLVSIASSVVSAEEVPLLAGKNWQAGVVTVTNDATTLNVEFTLNEETIAAGWLLTETQVHLGLLPGDFPVSRGGHLKIGEFDYIACYDGATMGGITIDLTGYAAGDVVLIAAHATLEQEVDTVVYMESAWAIDGPLPDSQAWADWFTYEIK